MARTNRIGRNLNSSSKSPRHYVDHWFFVRTRLSLPADRCFHKRIGKVSSLTAWTIVVIPARIASGNVGQASLIEVKSGWIGLISVESAPDAAAPRFSDRRKSLSPLVVASIVPIPLGSTSVRCTSPHSIATDHLTSIPCWSCADGCSSLQAGAAGCCCTSSSIEVNVYCPRRQGL